MWWSNKVSFVNGTKEDDSKCTVKIAENQETHSILQQALIKEVSSEDAKARTSSYHGIEFIDTIKKTLRLTRLLAFS